MEIRTNKGDLKQYWTGYSQSYPGMNYQYSVWTWDNNNNNNKKKKNAFLINAFVFNSILPFLCWKTSSGKTRLRKWSASALPSSSMPAVSRTLTLQVHRRRLHVNFVQYMLIIASDSRSMYLSNSRVSIERQTRLRILFGHAPMC